jgi:amidase
MRFEPTRRRLMLSATALAGVGACAQVRAHLPMIHHRSDALGDDDATAVVMRVKSGEISATEATEAAIERIERVSPQLNFMASRIYDKARTRAAGPLAGPFIGVPTLIKDLTPLAGAPLHFGSRAFADNVADSQPPYVDALLAAGLVPLGKSTAPEFGLTATTEPLLTGATRNPWDPTRSSGGSSGGAASAVASGAVPIADASDGGGSIRIPASCCGLVGLKVSRGRNIVAGAPERAIALSVPGCVSRSVRDTALWLTVMQQSGADAALPPVDLITGPNRARRRIGMQIPAATGAEPDPQVRGAIESVARTCEGLGHQVAETRMPIDGAAFADAFTLLWSAGAAEIVQQVSQKAPGVPLDDLLEPLTLGLAEHYRAAPEGALDRAVALLRGVEAQYDALFADYDVLLTPVLSRPAPPIGELSPVLPYDVGFPRVAAYAAYTPLQNVAGAPSMSLPLGMSADGLPIGALFSARLGQEKMLLELAYELEEALPWKARRPHLWAG